AVRPEGAPRRRMHHFLDRVDHDGFVDALFFGDLLDNPVQIDLHTASPGRTSCAPFISVSPARREPRHLFVKIVLVIGSRHLVETNRLPLAARLVVKLDSTFTDRHEPAHEGLLPIARAMRPDLHPLPHHRLEMLQLAQRPVDTRRRDLQRVAALDRVVHVEQIAQGRAQPLQVAQRNSAARLVHQQPQQRISRARAKSHRDQFITLAFDMRLEQLDHLFRGRMKPQGRHLLSPLAGSGRRSRLYVTKPKTFLLHQQKSGRTPTSREQDTTWANLSARRGPVPASRSGFAVPALTLLTGPQTASSLFTFHGMQWPRPPARDNGAR